MICVLVVVFVFNNRETFANTCSVMNSISKGDILRQNEDLIKNITTHLKQVSVENKNLLEEPLEIEKV